jgi:gamma-glutamyltranspeptidase
MIDSPLIGECYKLLIPLILLSGGLAMTVPTEIAGYKALYDRFGKLPWKTLFEPTIRFCFDGFPLGKGLYDVLVKKKEEVMNTPGLR